MTFKCILDLEVCHIWYTMKNRFSWNLVCLILLTFWFTGIYSLFVTNLENKDILGKGTFNLYSSEYLGDGPSAPIVSELGQTWRGRSLCTDKGTNELA